MLTPPRGRRGPAQPTRRNARSLPWKQPQVGRVLQMGFGCNDGEVLGPRARSNIQQLKKQELGSGMYVERSTAESVLTGQISFRKCAEYVL